MKVLCWDPSVQAGGIPLITCPAAVGPVPPALSGCKLQTSSDVSRAKENQAPAYKDISGLRWDSFN